MAYRKGLVISWGLLNMIASIDGAVEKESSLTTVCTGSGPLDTAHAPTPINQVRKCKTCGEVNYADLKKAEKVGTEFRVVEQQEVAAVKEATLGATKKMLTLTVHDAAEYDTQTLVGDGVYYVAPDGPGQVGPYNLLLDAVKRHPEKRFVTNFTPTSAVSMWVLRVFNDRLVIEKRCWPEQIKAAPAVDVIEPDDGLQAQVDLLVANTTVTFDAASYRNEYATALEALLASKDAVAGDLPEASKTEARTVATSGVVDLSATLAAMLQAAGPPPTLAGVEAPAKPAPKKRAAKKAAPAKPEVAA